jgi:hypothetical protein
MNSWRFEAYLVGGHLLFQSQGFHKQALDYQVSIQYREVDRRTGRMTSPEPDSMK